MIIPSIDIKNGRAVQLVGGEALAIDAGDPFPIAERFARVGEIAVIDLDAARGSGSNEALVAALVARFPCRVGGGIRDVETARRWLDRGARRIILGTRAVPEVLRALPRDRVIAALDARDGEVVVEGWRKGTGQTLLERASALRDLVGGFLVTFVEREGRMGGTDLARARALVAEVGDARVTIAGGVTTVDEVAALDAMGCDAQVGMALYTGALSLADAFLAPLLARTPAGPWPTVVVDEGDRALGLVYSTRESVGIALDEGRGVYFSRSRGLWRKGETSGATQRLVDVALDCDRDTLRFRVEQSGAGFCHRETASCFDDGRGLFALERTIQTRAARAPSGSYTRRLLDDGALLAAKLVEEAGELARADTRDEVVAEAADLLFFTLTRLVAAGASLADVERVLDGRALTVTRRAGDAKPASSQRAFTEEGTR